MSSVVSVWRICTGSRIDTAFSGRGAYRLGGRWNLPGVRIVYCSESKALAALEVLVNLKKTDFISQLDFRAIRVDLPLAQTFCPSWHPKSWNAYPYGPESQEFGTRWARESHTLALRVPSAVISGEFNYLLNPDHPDFARLKISEPETFEFDRRLAQ